MVPYRSFSYYGAFALLDDNVFFSLIRYVELLNVEINSLISFLIYLISDMMIYSFSENPFYIIGGIPKEVLNSIILLVMLRIIADPLSFVFKDFRNYSSFFGSAARRINASSLSKNSIRLKLFYLMSFATIAVTNNLELYNGEVFCLFHKINWDSIIFDNSFSSILLCFPKDSRISLSAFSNYFSASI